MNHEGLLAATRNDCVIKALSLCSLLFFRQVVLKALDPVFEIEDPYAYSIQGSENTANRAKEATGLLLIRKQGRYSHMSASSSDLITVTNIRINFTRLFTLGDTLLRKRRNPQDKYYYALYDMVVRGSCFCNGHASQCTPVDQGRGDTFSEAGMVRPE